MRPGLSAEPVGPGHADEVVVAGCGLPIPPGAAVADPAFPFGVPAFPRVPAGLLDGLLGGAGGVVG
ncbi:RbsD/FucU domain-containing protein [Saccharothrix algeriensis]|uniref:RbsD/FucU domain-containing protein n=1 Tax=Saccharothrix algeriensis TaxID=173560 RepID=UPI0019581B73|nr:RbsD/FucU domain-containing protein [Saccharothrix algeriensis]